MDENLKKSEINDEFLKGRGMEIYRDSASAKTLSTDRWVKDHDLYEGNFSEGERQFSEVLGVDRLFIKKTYTNIQRILVDVIETFVSDPDEVVQVEAQKNVNFAYTQAVKAVMNYRLNGHPINFYQEMYEAAQDALKISGAVFKVFPEIKTEKATVKRMVISDDGIEREEEFEEERIVSYAPRLIAVPPEDVFFSKRATWKTYHQHPMQHRYTMTREDLKRQGFKNVDLVGETTDLTMGDDVKIKRDEDDERLLTGAEENVYQNQLITVYETWDFLPGENGDIVSGSYYLLGDEKGPQVVGKSWKENDLPYKFDELEPNRPPLIWGTAFPEAHKLRGKSFPEITESLQKETNAQRNQFREAVARALRPHVYVNKDAEVNLMSLINRRIGGYIQGQGPASSAIGEIPTLNPNAINTGHQAIIDRDYSEVSSIPPNLLGFSSREETATASTQQLANANKRIQLIVTSLAHTLVLPAFKFVLRLEQTYDSDEFVNKVTGQTLGWVLPDDQFPAREVIQGDFDVKVNLGLNKQAQINKMLLLIDRLNQANATLIPLIQAGIVDPSQVQFKNPVKAIEAILPILGFKDANEWNIQANQPQPGAGEVQGIASQPRQVQDPSQENIALEPEGTGVGNIGLF